MLIAVLKIRQVQGSMFLALGDVFSPPHVVDSLAFNYEEIGVATDAVLAFNLETQCCIKRHAPVPRFLSDPSQQANELEKSDIGRIAVHIAARIVSQAAAGECLVSRTVKDLVAGANLSFADRGSPHLKGLAEPVSVFAASQ
jgi:hypothetical protein